MTATSSISPPARPRKGRDDDLQVLRDVLLRRGWESRLLHCLTCGEQDVRLEVRQTRGPTVELLGPWAGGACGDCWQAVRLRPPGRVVWCGPPRSCGRTELIEFVENLLRLDDEQLAGRYPRLG
jgi:predicted RNA-binding protein with PUA domain